MLKRIFNWIVGTPTYRTPSRLRSSAVRPDQMVHAFEEPQSPPTAIATEVPPTIGSLPRAQRLCMEQQIIAKQFSAFLWQRQGEGARIEGAILTSAGQSYEVRVLVPAAFPYTHPQVFVVSPIQGRGASLTGVSHAMHTLTPDLENHPQICLYNDRNWNPALTLHHVLIKAAVWLEAFEQHRRTGRPINDFLADVR